jgi:hypothetical protein
MAKRDDAECRGPVLQHRDDVIPVEGALDQRSSQPAR